MRKERKKKGQDAGNPFKDPLILGLSLGPATSHRIVLENQAYNKAREGAPRSQIQSHPAVSVIVVSYRGYGQLQSASAMMEQEDRREFEAIQDYRASTSSLRAM